MEIDEPAAEQRSVLLLDKQNRDESAGMGFPCGSPLRVLSRERLIQPPQGSLFSSGGKGRRGIYGENGCRCFVCGNLLRCCKSCSWCPDPRATETYGSRIGRQSGEPRVLPFRTLLTDSAVDSIFRRVTLGVPVEFSPEGSSEVAGENEDQGSTRVEDGAVDMYENVG